MKKGFTLIELLIVVLIIGILAAIALPQYQLNVMKSKYSNIMELGNSLALAQQRYYLANGAFTSDLRNLDISFEGCDLSLSSCGYDWGNCYIACEPSYSCGGCSSTEMKLWYFYTNWKNPLCLYVEGDDKAEKVCRAFTGKSQNDGGSYGTNSGKTVRGYAF